VTTAHGRHRAAHRDGPERERWLSRPSVAAVREPPIVPHPVIAAAVLLGCVIVAGAVLVLAGTVWLPAATPRTARLPTAPAASWQPGRYRPPARPDRGAGTTAAVAVSPPSGPG
jgi:hypothetical protein